jgi:hypothetical protein
MHFAKAIQLRDSCGVKEGAYGGPLEVDFFRLGWEAVSVSTVDVEEPLSLLFKFGLDMVVGYPFVIVWAGEVFRDHCLHVLRVVHDVGA